MKQIYIVSMVLAGYLACPVQKLEAQDDEYKYGLIGSYQGTDETLVRRVDADLMFDWRQGSPDPRITTPFESTWRGQILIQSLTPYRFAAQVAGEIKVVVNGQTALVAASERPAWVSGEEVELDPGFQEIEVTFRSRNEVAVLKLFWSSGAFALEPVPPHLLFHEEDDQPLVLIERGRQLFEGHRCHRCHSRTLDAELLPAPALWGITNGTSPQWIVEKLLGKNPESPQDKMPHFGFSRQDAEDIAMYLHRISAPFDLVTAPDVQPSKNGPTPNELLHSIGCLACHKVGNLGHEGPYSGGDLSHIAGKRSADWLSTWLASPDRINPQHRMPVFKMNRTDRGLLVQALAQLGRNNVDFNMALDEIPTDQVNRGRELVKQFSCANCHKIPAIERDAREFASLKEPVRDWGDSCLSEQPDPGRKRPYYPHLDRPAVRAYLESQFETELAPLSPFEEGRLVLERKNCLSCHRRGTGQGLLETAGAVARTVKELQGESQLLIPPSLNAVGDKLRDDVLGKALSGDQDRMRANWLKVQMPRFHHSPQDLAALKNYIVGHDRIPAEAQPELPSVDLKADEILVTGRQLIGAGGFSCIACHQVGDYVPRNVALGTRGSDLMGIANRLRPEFYFRWTQAPIRIIPGMEMPSYQKPVPGLLGEDVNRQLATVWKALHDERFEPPSNPSQVEQFWQLAADGPPRMVRDVFTVAEENGGGYVPRALAIGLPNQHGLLFDLETASLREWRFGDFAQQRTVGKSWYWDLAGTHVATGFTAEAGFVLVRDSDGTTIPLTRRNPDRLARLTDYQVEGDSIRLRYELDYMLNDTALTARIDETIRPVQVDSRSGWERQIAAEGIPAGYRLSVLLPDTLTRRFGAEISLGETVRLTVTGTAAVAPIPSVPIERPVHLPPETPITTLPGYVGQRLRLPTSIMPTALAWDAGGKLIFTSLKGHVYRALDTDGDGLEDALQIIEEGLAAPFGILTDGRDLLVAHKPELLRLIESSAAGHGSASATRREVVADGWGYTDDYHDWTTGPVRDASGNLFVATGSDYAQKNRLEQQLRWRGKVLKIDTSGAITPYAHEFRYPVGIAFDARGRLFVSDQQGVQNTFNEINHVVEGGRYGVPARDDPSDVEPKVPVTVQIPHPWTRSVNGVFFLPEDLDSPFAGHGIGCEFNGKFLIRFTTQEVDGVLQGATYPFSRTEWDSDEETFLGPISGAVGPQGEIYIGSLYDSGWLGGQNTGEIVRLRPQGEIPNGIREVRAIPGGFEIEFVRSVNAEAARRPQSYSLSGYTRVWQGSYGTDDSGRYSPEIQSVQLSGDGRTVKLLAGPLKTGFVYEINVRDVAADGGALFPSYATYTLNHLAE